MHVEAVNLLNLIHIKAPSLIQMILSRHESERLQMKSV